MKQYKMSLAAFFEINGGGVTYQIFMLMLGAMVFMVKGDVTQAFSAAFHFANYELTPTKGKVLAVNTIEYEESTGYEFQFEFIDELDQPHQNFAYSSQKDFNIGDIVDVEYVFIDPEYARIIDTDFLPLDSANAFIFSLIFVFLIGWPLKRLFSAIKSTYIVNTGAWTQGRCTGNTESNLKSNDRSMYNATFSFTDLNGQNQTFVRLTAEPCDTKASYDIFYLPKKPTKALTLQVLPGHCVIDKDRRKVVASSQMAPILAMTGPMLLIAAILAPAI